MSTAATSNKPLSIADLAERWHCSTDTVLVRVREKGVPFIWLGKGEPRLNEAGRKHLIFREASIEQWEIEQERRWKAKPDGPAVAAVATTGKAAKVADPFAPRPVKSRR